MASFRDTRGSDRALCICYGIFTAVNFVIMMWLAVSYTLKHSEGGFFGLVGSFVQEALINQAGAFIYADLTLVWFVLSVFMVVEARRLGIRHIWAYIIGAPALALAVSFPLFMLVRQLKIATPPTGVESTVGR